jgi:hypothetical protein
MAGPMCIGRVLVDPRAILGLVQYLAEAFECRISLDPAVAILLGIKKFVDAVGVGTVDDGLGNAYKLEFGGMPPRPSQASRSEGLAEKMMWENR